MERQWSYWTKNKLQILEGYLPAFNRASTKALKGRLYLDLMAGRPENVERLTGNRLDGSPRLALNSDPGFTHHVFFELANNAEKLEAALCQDFPDKISSFHVVPGDCNETIDAELRRLRQQDLHKGPAFAFLDQQAAEIHWETIVKLARFKGPNPRFKPELWLLVSPAMTVKGARGSGSEEFRERVTRFYGTRNWLNIQEAREKNVITPHKYRDEMSNLIRYRLAEDLGYKYTHRIPMKMLNGTTIYDMLFATDHPAGDKIMRHLYIKAAEREPRMMAEARRLAKMERERKAGAEGLFEIPESSVPVVDGSILWKPDQHWDPSQHDWWTERD